MTSANEQINIFLEKDSMLLLKSASISASEPKDLKKDLKKIYLAAKPIRVDFEKFQLNKKRKIMTKHKKEIQHNLIRSSATNFIINVSKIHHSLTYFLFLYSTESRSIENKTHNLGKVGYMSDLLKDKHIKELLDTDEISTLYTFNSLRNSLIHSSDYLVFSYIEEEYFTAIYSLLDDVQQIFKYFEYSLMKVNQELHKKKS